MRYITSLIAIISALVLSSAATFSQQTNVDKSVMTFYDGQQTLRVLQYPEPPPGNNKIYRLETLAENGYPALTLISDTQPGVVTFEDKFPYDNDFNDNSSPFTSAEAAQSLYAFQSVMKVFGSRFGWKGLDGTGVAPIKIVMGDSQKYPFSASAYYATNGSIDWYFLIKDLNGANEFENVIETIAHEYLHGTSRYRKGFNNIALDNCAESNSLEEGIADIFGVYVRNKIAQIPPQNFDWGYKKSEGLNTFMSDPKAFHFPDTYNGQYYQNECHPNFFPHPNGGVLFKWCYLLSEGFQSSAYNDLGYGYSIPTGIGIEKCIDILWATLPKTTKYLSYATFRAKTLETAGQLYGLNSTEYIAVQNAWCAVGVCDYNLPSFAMSPANATSFIGPWPAVHVNLTWTNNNLVQEWEVQMSPKYDFSDSVQTMKLSNFSMVIGPNQTLMSTATAEGYFHPGTTVYARAKISQAGANFCKGLNPLCSFYQKFGPIHAFKLKDQKAQFWPTATLTSVKAWNGQLTWKSVNDAERYRLQISNDPAFTTLVYDGITLHTGNYMETGVINTSLGIGQTYYARVRAERLDLLKLKNNHGAWSDVLTVTAEMPSTAIIQAKSQKLNDPPQQVSTIGRQLNWDPVAGATNFNVQVAKDNAFSNIVSSVNVAGNVTSTTMLFPVLPNLTDLYVRVIPQNGAISGICSNVWRIKIDETAALPAMKSPANGSTFPFKHFAAAGFEWKSGTLNMNTVDHFELHLTKKTSGLVSLFTSQGKAMQLFIQDPLMFNDHQGLQASVLAVNSLGAKTALSQPFDYVICDDHPAVFFPGDLGKVDPGKNFNIQWFPSESFPAGSQFLVTIKENGLVALPGFTDKPTTALSMLVPAGTLTNGKNYTVTVKNSSSCPALLLPVTFFSAVGSGSVNQPQPPKLVNFTIELKGFRNDLDGLAWETSDYVLGIEIIAPDGNPLNPAPVDPNGNQVSQLLVDSENSGVIIVGNSKPEGKYKLRLKMLNIFNTLQYYPFDQPRFSVLLNGQTVVSNHVITADFVNPASAFNEWQVGFQFADIILDIK